VGRSSTRAGNPRRKKKGAAEVAGVLLSTSNPRAGRENLGRRVERKEGITISFPRRREGGNPEKGRKKRKKEGKKPSERRQHPSSCLRRRWPGNLQKRSGGEKKEGDR